MYAIVDIAGQQFKVEKDQKIYVHCLEGEEGSKVDFDQVLLVEDDGKVQVGAPVVKNTVVKASILSHVKGDKVQVFKKKRRKGFKVHNGHRQAFTQLLIEGIGAGTAKVAAKKKEEEKPKAEASTKKPVAEKAAPKKADDKPAEKKTVAKKTTVKKTETAEKKTAEKKTSAKKAETAEKKATAPKTAKKPAASKAASKTTAKKDGADKLEE